MSIYPLPQNSTIEVSLKSAGYYVAIFSWNNGEINSLDDFEIPICGADTTEIMAIGRLIQNYQRFNHQP